ncbi:UPF0147 family protein [Candidatus Woesearchaeota archaeon]|nr:UPF0147 family protein [Candidatus Woesearchaeota archaeon]
MDERLQNIIEALEELSTDGAVPRNIKSKVEDVLAVLKDETQELSLKINKALSELDDISEDSNLQADSRTQIWNIASMLEML